MWTPTPSYSGPSKVNCPPKCAPLCFWLIDMLTQRGFKPQYWMLDTKCGHLLKNIFIKMTINFQLVPAGMYMRNCVERAIQIFKKHFIASILGVDPKFPMHL